MRSSGEKGSNPCVALGRVVGVFMRMYAFLDASMSRKAAESVSSYKEDSLSRGNRAVICTSVVVGPRCRLS